MREELKFKLWAEYPELREELFGDELTEDEEEIFQLFNHLN